ncbi:MAG: ATP-binding protein [Anaerolineales bacterium]|jgi:signal transduction histidine kinase
MPDASPASRQVVMYCPQCEHPLPGDVRTCPNCGIDLALLSLLGEKAYLDGLPKFAPLDTTPQWLVPRIGDFLIRQGVIDQAQLQEALDVQRTAADRGEHMLLGQTLLKLGFLNRETLDLAVTQQIVELHTALQESNRTLQKRVDERTKELRHALERLTEINQIKANLISNISHELRTPLSHIKGYAELLAAGELGGLESEQMEAAQVIRRAAERLGSLIEDLIEFSTAAREGLTLRVAPTAIAPMIEGVIQRSQPKAEKAGVRLEVDLADGLPEVKIDQERLSWALFQLVDNGIKFTPAEGQVVVGALRSDLGVDLTVRDTGIGIPVDRLEEIFEPFHQLDGSATRRYGGTGLGLALVKLIVEAHGSQLNVQSAEEQGTVFSFTVPTA